MRFYGKSRDCTLGIRVSSRFVHRVRYSGQGMSVGRRGPGNVVAVAIADEIASRRLGGTPVQFPMIGGGNRIIGNCTGISATAERLLGCPHRRGCDGVFGAVSRVGAAAAGEPGDDFYRHVMIAEQLTAETYPAESLGGEGRLFGFGHAFGFPGEELDFAGCAAGMAAAGV